MSLLKRFEQEEGVAIFDGNEVLVKAGLENGVGFWTGYPGSPVAGIHDVLEQLTPGLFAEKGIVYHRALNETTASAELGGSQKAGVNAVASAKNVGFTWMLDHLAFENLTGTGKKSGALVVIGDDLVASSSTIALDTRRAFEMLKMPYLEPSSNQEIKDFFGAGLRISRESGLYVGMRIVSDQGDSGSTIHLTSNQYPVNNALQPRPLSITPATIGSRLVASMEAEFPERLATAVRIAAEEGLNRVLNPESPGTLGLVTSGKSFSDLYQALHDIGLHQQVRILKVGMPYPLDEPMLLDYASGLDQIIVLESKEPVMEERIQAALHRNGMRIPVYGKAFPAGYEGFPRVGELTPDSIKAQLGPMLLDAFPNYATQVQAELTLQQEIMNRDYNPTPLRLPTFCPGCPHRASISLTKKLKHGGFIPLEQLEAAPGVGAPDVSQESSLLVHGDIGCYTMAVFPPFQMVDTMSAMGQGGAVADGLAAFSSDRKVAFVGDGTFIHSGRNSIMSSIANGTDITYIVLNNDTIAMTGGQTTPVHTRRRVKNSLNIESIIRGYGVEHVTNIATEEAYARKYQKTLERYIDMPGVKVIIVNKECAITEGRRERREKAAREAQGVYDAFELHYRIQPDICEMCYDCSQKTGCLGLDIKEVTNTIYGPKMQINKSTCYNDGACTMGHCPSFQTLRIKRADPARRRDVIPPDGLVEPAQMVSIGDGYTIFIPGVGGMGVLTTSALLSYAAMFDGKLVTFTNRIGMAQKNGAVDSHLIIREKEDAHATKISAGKTDLYLALDMLEGARPDNLNLIAPDRTRSIVNTERTQTVLTIAGMNTFPEMDQLIGDIGRYSREVTSMNIFDISEKLLGNRQYANIFIMGVAYQMGAIPISAESIEEAIHFNGKAIQHNLAAFRWGRLWVSDRARVEAEISAEESISAEALRERNKRYLSLEPSGARRVADYEALLADAPNLGEDGNRTLFGWLYTLIQWGGAGYAREYLDFVNHVHQRDNGDFAMTRTVAHNLARLMAYKDEFEVARLALSHEEKDRLRREYDLQKGDKVEIAYYLDPPWTRFLRDGGRKMELKRSRLLFALLKRLRFLRPALSRFDEARRLELRLPGWYRELVTTLLDHLGPSSYDQAEGIADVARGIVGYDYVKLNNWRQVEREVEKKLEALVSRQPSQETAVEMVA
jgi:indolepyruvate ferredoxin oxidoreductase